MLYLIGLGLDVKGISLQGLEAIKKCKKIYLENYTVDFPYNIQELEKVIGKKIISASRELVESNSLVKEARKANIVLLVYGSPLTATTHISLIQEAKKQKVKYEIIYGASILDAILETGLQAYKFGKTASMPKWNKEKNFNPESFVQIIKENNSINSHTLILIDIDLDFKDALEQLEASMKNKKIKLDKMVICSSLGTTHEKIFYGKISKLKNKKIVKPYCIIILSKLHFVEKEVLKDMEI